MYIYIDLLRYNAYKGEFKMERLRCTYCGKFISQKDSLNSTKVECESLWASVPEPDLVEVIWFHVKCKHKKCEDCLGTGVMGGRQTGILCECSYGIIKALNN